MMTGTFASRTTCEDTEPERCPQECPARAGDGGLGRDRSPFLGDLHRGHAADLPRHDQGLDVQQHCFQRQASLGERDYVMNRARGIVGAVGRDERPV